MKENIVYRGSERRVIVVKSASSKHFEEAHFFLKAEEGVPISMPDLLREANRIVEQSLLPPKRKNQRERRHWFGRGFVVGMIVTAAISAGVWLAFAVL